MTKKVAIVTGANKGIGFAIVRGLCKRFDGVVYLTSRDEKRGRDAVLELNKEGLNPNYHQLDVTDKESVVALRDHIKEEFGGIDVLVNNAGIGFNAEATEPPVVQAVETLRINFFSVLMSCDILFPLLRNGARVVNVSSSKAHLSKIPSKTLRNRLKDPELTINELSDLMKRYIEETKQGTQAAEWGNSSYAVSKVGLTALTMIQQRLLRDRNVMVNAVHPGYVDTDLTSHKGPLSIDEGAVAPLFLALDAPDTVQGQYVWYDKKIVNWDGDMPTINY